MLNYIIIYIKIAEDKEHGLVVHGPWFGPILLTEDEANLAAKKLAKESRNVNTLPKIFKIDSDDPYSQIEAMSKAKTYFDKTVKMMREAKVIVNKR